MKKYTRVNSEKIVIQQLIFYSIWLGIFLVISILLLILENPNFKLIASLSLFPFLGVIICLYKMEWWLISEDAIIVRNVFGVIKSLDSFKIETIKIISLNFDRMTEVMMYVINDFNNQYKIRITEINPTKYPELKMMNAYNKKNGPLLIPVNEITSKYLEKYIKK